MRGVQVASTHIIRLWPRQRAAIFDISDGVKTCCGRPSPANFIFCFYNSSTHSGDQWVDMAHFLRPSIAPSPPVTTAPFIVFSISNPCPCTVINVQFTLSLLKGGRSKYLSAVGCFRRCLGVTARSSSISTTALQNIHIPYRCSGFWELAHGRWSKYWLDVTRRRFHDQRCVHSTLCVGCSVTRNNIHSNIIQKWYSMYLPSLWVYLWKG